MSPSRAPARCSSRRSGRILGIRAPEGHSERVRKCSESAVSGGFPAMRWGGEPHLSALLCSRQSLKCRLTPTPFTSRPRERLLRSIRAETSGRLAGIGRGSTPGDSIHSRGLPSCAHKSHQTQLGSRPTASRNDRGSPLDHRQESCARLVQMGAATVARGRRSPAPSSAPGVPEAQAPLLDGVRSRRAFARALSLAPETATIGEGVVDIHHTYRSLVSPSGTS
jgi:hypothetical protein